MCYQSTCAAKGDAMQKNKVLYAAAAAAACRYLTHIDEEAVC